jgi:hypothetical protein
MMSAGFGLTKKNQTHGMMDMVGPVDRPLNRVVIAGSMTFSNEEKWLLLVNFGFQF